MSEVPGPLHKAADKGSTEQFLIGNAPFWADICSTIAHNPTLLVRDWVWGSNWSNLQKTAGRMFFDFTVNFFLTLAPDALKTGQYPKPNGLEEAMKLWTVKSLLDTLKDVAFKPSNHGLKGKVNGKHNVSFKDMVHFFSQLLSSILDGTPSGIHF
jgi:hypothetical protein